MRLIHLSDPHFGAEDARIARETIDHVRQFEPDAVIVTGDFSMSARRSELSAARQWLSCLPRPCLVVPGNHDIPKHNHAFDRFFRPFHRYRKFISPELECLLDLDRARIVGLNSCRPFGWTLDWSQGRLDAEQCRRLQTAFAADDPRLRIAFWHHPVIAPPANPRALVQPLARVKRAIARARVDLLLGGHFHQSYVLTLPCGGEDCWSPVVSQVSTATSIRRQGEPNGFHVCEFSSSGDALHVLRYLWTGVGFEQVDQVELNRDPRRGWTRLTPASQSGRLGTDVISPA